MTGFWRRLLRRPRDEARRAVDDEIGMHLELKTVVVLTLVALAASLIPACMAAKADPRQALQAE